MNLTIKNEIGQCNNKVFLQFEGGELTGALSSGFDKVFGIQSAAESFDKKAPAVFSNVWADGDVVKSSAVFQAERQLERDF